MAHNPPRVSIGMPVYNGEKYIAQAIDSILAQTYSDFEFLISDNASTDRTQAICEHYVAQDARVRYYRNPKNLGLAPNYNRVFALSSGVYFKWATYDDLIKPEFLARCVAILDQHPSVVVCYARAEIIDARNDYVVDYNPGPDTRSPNPAERFRNLLLRPEYAIQQMGVMRAATLHKTKLYGSYSSSDEILLAELALRGEYIEIPERLYLYRRHAMQSTATGKQRDRMTLFDTAFVGKITLPTWLYFFGGIDAIRRASLDGRARTQCYATMARWALRPDHLRALGKDVLLALRQSIYLSRANPVAVAKNSEPEFRR